MRVLGAILAGGKSRRFGSDKAAAMFGAKSLMEHAIAIVGAQTEEVAICGRMVPGITSLSDRPGPDLGPLGGLNAALQHADRAGFDAVLCVPVDVHPIPIHLRQLLIGDTARVFQIQHAVGFWPVRYASALGRHVADGGASFGSWIESTGAELVADGMLGLENVNRPDDLCRLVAQSSD